MGLNKILCWLFGHNWKDIQHYRFTWYDDFKCERKDYKQCDRCGKIQIDEEW